MSNVKLVEEMPKALSLYMGCDPEFFFSSGGQIIGAERVIPKAGLVAPTASGLGDQKFVIDGVQVELHPAPRKCRAQLGQEITAAFQTLKEFLKDRPDMRPDFSGVVEVSQEELDRLSKESKRLGCAPSRNLYDQKASINVDPNTYRTRSAGGHIHIGYRNEANSWPTLIAEPQRLVALLDAVLGNTCVLLDRDPNAAKRREVYGRAGEHRLPKHGLEYRTLSNFWLRSYPLMGLVFGLARLACNMLEYSHKPTLRGSSHIMAYEEEAFTKRYVNSMYPTIFKMTPEERRKTYYFDHYDKALDLGGSGVHPVQLGRPGEHYCDFAGDFMSRVDLERVRTAINTNDADLAWPTFVELLSWAERHLQKRRVKTDIENNYYSYPISGNTEDLEDVQCFFSRPIEAWFPEDPFTHWTSIKGGHLSIGWEMFLEGVVRPTRLGEQPKTEADLDLRGNFRVA